MLGLRINKVYLGKGHEVETKKKMLNRLNQPKDNIIAFVFL